MSSRHVISVVFPVPGPPVMTRTFSVTPRATASRCRGESWRDRRASQSATCAEASAGGGESGAATRRASRRAAFFSARAREGREASRPLSASSTTMPDLPARDSTARAHAAAVDVQQGRSLLDQLLHGHCRVALSGSLAENKPDSRLGPVGGIGGDAQVPGDGIGGPEPDPVDLRSQPVGVLPDRGDGARAVHLPDPGGKPRGDAVRLQEHHDVPDRPLRGPRLGDLPASRGADALDLPQPGRRRVDDLEGRKPEAASPAARPAPCPPPSRARTRGTARCR